MRPTLLHPYHDRAKVAQATAILAHIYQLYDQGTDFSDELDRLELLLGREVPQYEVDGAIGAIAPETLAEDLLVTSSDIPLDLADPELLELLERIASHDGTEFQIGFWMRCLRANTGFDKLYDLLFHPEYITGNPHKLSPPEILSLARSLARKNP